MLRFEVLKTARTWLKSFGSLSYSLNCKASLQINGPETGSPKLLLWVVVHTYITSSKALLFVEHAFFLFSVPPSQSSFDTNCSSWALFALISLIVEISTPQIFASDTPLSLFCNISKIFNLVSMVKNMCKTQTNWYTQTLYCTKWMIW